MSQTKVLVVGLDGATLDLIEPWVRAGLLPAFARWLKTGLSGRLRTVPNMDTAPAWSTLATGLNPANHGLFHEMDWSPDHTTLQPAQASRRLGKSFWRIASEGGRQVAVINFPFTYPVDLDQGIMVAGYGAPDKAAPGFCHPPDYLADFQGTAGEYYLDSQIQMAMKEGRLEDAITHSLRVAERHTDALLYALQQQTVHLAVIAYNLPDELQHFFWQQMKTNQGPQSQAVLQGYRCLEQQIDRILTAMGSDTTFLIVSDHGFGPICATPEYLAAWLSDQGFLRFCSPADQPWRQRWIKSMYGWLRGYLSEPLKASLRRWLPALRNRVEADVRFSGIDWSQTVAYVGPSACEVWINTRGREVAGIVTPGPHYEQTCQTIIEALQHWCNGEGIPRLRAIHRREDCYYGRFFQRSPDITLEWNPAIVPPASTLPGNFSGFDADHQPEGVFLAVGPAVKTPQLVQDARLEDIAPTVLHWLGVDRPEPMDGKIIEGLGRS